MSITTEPITQTAKNIATHVTNESNTESKETSKAQDKGQFEKSSHNRKLMNQMRHTEPASLPNVEAIKARSKTSAQLQTKPAPVKPEQKKPPVESSIKPSVQPSVRSLVQIGEELDQLRATLAALYVPKHFDGLMKKVGTIEENTRLAKISMNTCYQTTFVVFFMFMLLAIGVVYFIWRLDLWKLWLKEGSFVKRARRLRLSRGSRSVAEDRGYFSSPETGSSASRPVRRDSKLPQHTTEVKLETDHKPIVPKNSSTIKKPVLAHTSKSSKRSAITPRSRIVIPQIVTAPST